MILDGYNFSTVGIGYFFFHYLEFVISLFSVLQEFILDFFCCFEIPGIGHGLSTSFVSASRFSSFSVIKLHTS